MLDTNEWQRLVAAFGPQNANRLREAARMHAQIEHDRSLLAELAERERMMEVAPDA